MLKSLVSKIFAIGLAFAACSAQAGIVGATVNVDFYYPNTGSLYCSNGAAVVGGGVEYPASCSGFSPVSIDIGANSITVNTGGATWSGGAFNGFELDVLGGIDILSAFYSGGSMGVTGISIIDGDLWLNFAGQSGGIATFTFTDGTVPEPAGIVLVALGLLGLAGTRRKQQ